MAVYSGYVGVWVDWRGEWTLMRFVFFLSLDTALGDVWPSLQVWVWHISY